MIQPWSGLSFILGIIVIGFWLASITSVRAQVVPSQPVPADATEDTLIKKIRELDSLRRRASGPQVLLAKSFKSAEVLEWTDALLQRFPETSFLDEALMAKLAALGDLARTQPNYLAELHKLNDTIGGSNPSPRLAAENAFYAIQAFVLGARAESMPEGQRHKGTLERYEAFLADYPNSEHRPIVWASLIRTALALNQVDRAKSELIALQTQFPNHSATKRAKGEVHRVTGIGQPFQLTYQMQNGQVIRAGDFLGQVLVIHFWATWSPRSMDELPRLIKIREENKDRGLALIGVNVDKNRKQIDAAFAKHRMDWPQYIDEKGLENDILIGAGVIEIPTYLVVDRAGILRAVDPGEHLETLVRELLANPKETTEPAKP
ncbi:MAG: redoxin domain-containing protein [Planctomycetota bacterium]